MTHHEFSEAIHGTFIKKTKEVESALKLQGYIKSFADILGRNVDDMFNNGSFNEHVEDISDTINKIIKLSEK